MARYLLLMHGDEAAGDEADEGARATMIADYGALAARMREAGHLLEADELAPSREAAIVRVRDGITDVVDGPFAETKEQLGGFFLVACDRDTALAYAAQAPGARTGAVEVREIVEA